MYKTRLWFGQYFRGVSAYAWGFSDHGLLLLRLDTTTSAWSHPDAEQLHYFRSFWERFVEFSVSC